MNDQQYPFKHRDLNWLSFNERVLQEAEDVSNPIYERLKFLAIFSSNLDEYFRVRVSRLRQIKKIDKKLRKKLALKPNKQVKEILRIVKKQQERFGEIFYKELIPKLAKQNIYLISEKKYSFEQQEFATEYFISKILPLLRITYLESDKKETFLKNNHLYFIVTFTDNDTLGIINIPTKELGRFICFPVVNEKHYITFIDDIIKQNLDHVFENKTLDQCYEIKLSRDAELYIDDEFEGVLAEKIKASLSQRNSGQPTRLLYDIEMPKDIKNRLRAILDLGKIDMIPGARYHNFSDFFSFPDPTHNSDLHYKSLKQVKHRHFEDSENYFNTIAKKDQLVHFPYMSFDYVQNLINQAAHDPSVTHIKISLYRVATESELTSALLTALKNNKKVTVFVEAKARFDEENNLKWGKTFEEHGASVHYSYPKIKVHSKILLIHREEEKIDKKYAYIGTGNFNAKTSKIYCDHGLFTANPDITEDLYNVFEVLIGNKELIHPNNLLVSPFTTRSSFEALINKEIALQKAGNKGLIQVKLNSLEDTAIIQKLYEASQAGVKIEMLVRGFSRLIPGIPEISNNIHITSIIDQYLEHGRIFIFNNNGDSKIYMGSADWMTRNLDKRIEVITPILDPDLKNELTEILNIQLKDNVKARIQDEKESNDYVIKKDGTMSIRSQYSIREYLQNTHVNIKLSTK